MKLSVVIVNYNVKHYLWQCLDSVRRASAGLDVETWVVDNASTDGSIALLQKDFPEVHYIENTENVGFAKANNQAIRQAKGELVLLLNPDTFVAEDTLAACIRFFAEHPKAGALGIHMINRDGSFARESRRGLPTPATSFYKVIGLCNLYPTHPRFGRYYMGHLPEYIDGKIEVISGAFMMIRREALELAGMLDEDYFMYGEDIDLSYRIAQAGWECWYTPSQMLHYKGESTQMTSFRYVQNFYNAMLIFFRKHFARRYWFSWLIIELAVVTMGALSMCRKWLHIGYKKLRKQFCAYHSITSIPETLCFLGSEEAWSDLSAICERNGLKAKHITNLDEADKDVTYLTFEVTPEGRPYQTMLRHMITAHQNGFRSAIGTYNPATQILILPNDIFS